MTSTADLDGQGDCVADGTVSIPANSTISCDFTVPLVGNAGESQTDYVFATVADDEGNQAIASATETVTFDNVDPTFELTKTPRPASVPEPGGTVRFTVRLTNTSPEPIRLAVADRHGRRCRLTTSTGRVAAAPPRPSTRTKPTCARSLGPSPATPAKR